MSTMTSVRASIALGLAAVAAMLSIALSLVLAVHVGFIRGPALLLVTLGGVVGTSILLAREARRTRPRPGVAVGFVMAVGAVPVALIVGCVLLYVLSNTDYYALLFPHD